MPVKILALFGSYARGNYTVASDVDVLLVYGGPPQDDAYARIRTVLNIPHIELHLYSEDEYQALKPTIDRMLKDSIPIAEA
ncbi:MAG: nucleotidyltransferase domain-containing protein [Chloroflexi bacterium]|nr:nucleotidyltransferase domain-containing protein [Chloroflexota bacterium]